MPASRAALVAKTVVTFLLTLDNQTMFRALHASHAAGRALGSEESIPKLSLTSWAGWRAGRSVLKHRMIQKLTPLLKGQYTRAMSWSQLTSRVQSVQWGLVTVWLSTLWRRSWVGRRLCNRQKRKLLSVESRPETMLSDQIDTQLMSGFILSVLGMISNWNPLTSISCMTCFSSKVLYHIPM